ncbi:hypothetical protein SteCoe_35871 [Stentor coeruleus]|uniref:Uncharacterized protein n=1 Tax=Stentor coeruleus TaxID=5963 RepID=A0A1R2ARJ7_9CILI|nr:hypothetical protein SteCoe_35871 [Stentor coeruleus]
MIFSDPSGDDGIHPVSPLIFPVVIPPPTRSEIVHRSQNSVIIYKKPVKHTTYSKSMHIPVNVDHFYYQVKEMLDDGTGSSVERVGNIIKLPSTAPKIRIPIKRTVKAKATKYLDDGSSFLKQEIFSSEERVRSIKAGKALDYLFPNRIKKFIEPNKNCYNRQRLGTPIRDKDSKELKFYSRKRQVSLINSSPHRPFIMLPSLKDILLHNEENKEGIFEVGEDLNTKFEKLEKSFTKRNRNDRTLLPDEHEKNLMKIVKSHIKSENIRESLTEDPVAHLYERLGEFEDGKEKLKYQLKEILATQKYDRPQAIWLKYKHFRTSEKASVYQGRMVDIWNMRMEAEKERVNHFSGMINQICWYRDILWFVIEKCQDINPHTYYILDYIKALTEEGITVTRELMRKVFSEIPLNERSNGINILMSKILIDLSTQFKIFG